jgi:hypothetical protein
MSDMDFFFRLLHDDESKPTIPKPAGGGCGAIISGHELYVASVVAPIGDRGYRLNRSFELSLNVRDQDATAEFAKQLRHIIEQNGLRRLMLRASPDSGKFTASPYAYKIETLLQLDPYLDVDIVHTTSVSNWVNRVDPPLPEPETDRLGVRMAKLQARAIEAAAFCSAHHEDPRFYSKRSGRHG